MFSTNLLTSAEILPDGKLYTNGQANSQFLILGVVLAVIWFILTAMFVYYLYSFNKQQTEEKIYGKPMLYTTLGLGVLILIDWILMLVIWSIPGDVFGIGGNNGDKAYAALIALTVIGFVLLVSAMIMMFFFLPMYGIALTSDRILFMGESIPYARITKIVKDTETGAIYVNYSQGKRTHKKQKFSSTSVFGQFILTNVKATGFDIVEENEKEYFNSLSSIDKAAEKQHDQEVTEKVKNKDKKED